MDNSVPEAFIFMKVGPYGGECLHEIVDRKNRELKKAGMIFWGYGKRGPLHPTEQVQPFAEEWDKDLGSIEVLMQEITSNPKKGIDYLSTENCKEKYSVDGEADEKDWKTIPSGICADLEHNLVLDKIRRCHFHLDLRKFEVGIGDSSGTKSAAEHLKGSSSKGCFVKAEPKYPGPAVEACITYRAYLKPPYAVFLK